MVCTSLLLLIFTLTNWSLDEKEDSNDADEEDEVTNLDQGKMPFNIINFCNTYSLIR